MGEPLIYPYLRVMKLTFDIVGAFMDQDNSVSIRAISTLDIPEGSEFTVNALSSYPDSVAVLCACCQRIAHPGEECDFIRNWKGSGAKPVWKNSVDKFDS